MTADELAAAVNSAGAYRRRDGSPVPPSLIRARASTAAYRDYFRISGGRISAS